MGVESFGFWTLGFLDDDEAERHCDEKSPESEFMVCMVFGGKFGALAAIAAIAGTALVAQ